VIPDSIVEQVRARADIVEVVGEQVSLKRAGKDFKALCPFHDEKTASFYVVPAKQFYTCFGCGESGDVFTFLMKRSGLSFLDAVRQLAVRVGVEIPEVSASDRPEPHARLYAAIAFAADQFREWLNEEAEGAAARKYLEARGIAPDVVARFGIGWAPDAWRRLRDAARQLGYTDDELLAAGLVKESERGDEPYDRFRGRVIFPIADVAGRTIAFGGRAVGPPAENVPKYLNSPETPVYHKGSHLYGLNWSKTAIRREGAALVVEGYMDYIALSARGVANVVAGMGTAMTIEQADLLSRYTGKAYLLYDSDMAGLKASFRTADALLRAGVHPLVVELPEGEDPDSLVRRSGAAALKPLLDAAPDALERKLGMLESRGYFADIEGSRRAVDRLLPTIRAALDPTLRDLYIDRVAQRTGVRRETLEQELESGRGARGGGAPARGEAAGPGAPWTGPPRRSGARARRGGGRGPWRPPPEPVDWRGESGRVRKEGGGAERLLLLLMLRDPGWIAGAAEAVRPVDLRDPGYRELFQALAAARESEATEAAADRAGTSRGVTPAERAETRVPFAESSLGDAARQRLEALRSDREEIADAAQSFRQAVADLRVPGLFLRLDDIDLRETTAQSDEEHAELMQERQRVHGELRALGVEAELGFKASRRYRRYAKQRHREPDEPFNDEA